MARIPPTFLMAMARHVQAAMEEVLAGVPAQGWWSIERLILLREITFLP